MDYFIYLKVPEYTKQFALHHFGDKERENVVNVKNWIILYGFVVDSLQIRKSYDRNEENGNLKVLIPDASMKRKAQWNYMSKGSKSELARLIRTIMMTSFWRFIMPVWDIIKLDKHKKKNQRTLDLYINRFFESNGIAYDESTANTFKKDFIRERKKLNRKYGIYI